MKDKGANTLNSQDQLAKHEQYCLTIRQLPIISLSALSADVMVAIIFYGNTSTHLLMVWLILSVISASILPIAFYLFYRKYTNPADPSLKGYTLMPYMGFTAGAGWGAIGFFLFTPQSFSLQLVLLVFLMGAAALTSMVTIAYRQFFYSIIVPILSIYAIRQFFVGDLHHFFIGLIPIVFGSTVIYLYGNIYKMLKDALLLRIEKEELLQKLSIEKEAVDKANDKKARFIATASHDLRQPLHAQGLLLSEIKKLNTSTKVEQALDKVIISNSQMRDAFNDLLDISRLDAKVIHPNILHFPIQKIFDDIIVNYGNHAIDRDLRFTIVSTRLWVESDPILLQRCVDNLVSNAIRYTETGGVVVGVRRGKKKHRIQVVDTGKGIGNNEKNIIFDDFVRLGSDSNERGLGLGLAISSQLLELLGHNLYVDSIEGKGSTFTIELPAAPKGSSADNAKVLIESPKLTNKLVVLVDDNEIILNSMQGIFKEWKATLVIATTPEQILLLLDSHARPDLIVTDYHFEAHSQQSGLELIECVRKKYNENIPSIVITADTDPEVLRLLTNNNISVLHKPVSLEDMTCLVSELIN